MVDYYYYRDYSTAGIIYIVVFSIALLILLIRWSVFNANKKKFYEKLDAGYYFVEDNYRWRRRRLLMVHPSNVDFTLGSPRVINPALIVR